MPRESYGFATQLGWGRPGWHTECVVMSTGLLGPSFDIHGGGLDLAFPHHENERAQAVLLGMPFAQRWIHNGFVELAGEKMSKSLGNTLSLRGAIARVGGRAVRLAYLRAHYRSPVEVSDDALAQASALLARLDEVARDADPNALERTDLAAFDDALASDLDTPSALAVLAETARAARAAAIAGERATASRRRAAVAAMLEALGLGTPRMAQAPLEVLNLVAAREEAKRAREWSRADELRERIREQGWQVRDTRSGPELVPIAVPSSPIASPTQPGA